MFDNQHNRYMTRSISDEVHLEVAAILWQLIDIKNKHGVELDYLQVFELSVSDGKQQIIHRQEVPEMKSLMIIPLREATPVTLTVWCIDSGETEMMLLPEDY